MGVVYICDKCGSDKLVSAWRVDPVGVEMDPVYLCHRCSHDFRGWAKVKVPPSEYEYSEKQKEFMAWWDKKLAKEDA